MNRSLEKRRIMARGIRDGVPIALGYFAVALSLGININNINQNAVGPALSAAQSFLASLLCLSSTGEFAAFTLIGANATYVEVAVMTLIINARYLLMSCALSQKLEPRAGIPARLLVGYAVTDEIFGIDIAYPGSLSPWYTFGAVLIAAPGWASGTWAGVMMGSLLPARIVSALSVAIYGMFIAVIVPPARRDRIIAVLVVSSMLLSWLAGLWLDTSPLFASLSGSMKVSLRVIALTVILSALAAWRFPKEETFS